MRKNNINTPSGFYKNIRPEFFSDSEINYEVKLTREILEFELFNISKNQKQDLFESLCRKLAEKYICPNLIPQVGPTGGGDGKVDSETHPVSKFISDRWFISETNWSSKDKWAFAISAKREWKSKLKSDVKKIVETERGYNQIYFFTNQAPSSKKKKDAEKEFGDLFKIGITIIDCEWILEKIYNNDLQELAVTTLNMSTSYLKKKEITGSRDAERNVRLKELENNISNPNRYLEYDLQLVEDCLESALISRKLEKPKDEVYGKFKRTIEFCKKTDSKKQWLRILYQKAFTALNYFDDYAEFIKSFNGFKDKFPDEPIFSDLELYTNLFNLTQGLVASKVLEENSHLIKIKEEKKKYFEILEKAELNKDKKTTGIIARTYRLFQLLIEGLKDEKDIKEITTELGLTIEEGEKHLDYPFEPFSLSIEKLGNLVPENKHFDKLIDIIAELKSSRNSDLASGITYFNRGRQKLLSDAYVDSIRYFGKAAQRLIKEDSQEALYLSLTGIAIAFNSLGLIWASNNSLYIAGSIAFKSWYQDGKITKRIKYITYQLLVNELLIGRIPVLLMWHELYVIIRNQLEIDTESENQRPDFIDACLGVRLLNSIGRSNIAYNKLPDLFASQNLHISEVCCNYILGDYDRIKADYSEIEHLSTNEEIDIFFNKIFNQPFRSQILYESILLDNEVSILKSNILGCTIEMHFTKTMQLLLIAEFYLAFFESFFSTSALEIIPKSQKFTISIEYSEKHKTPSFKTSDNKDTIVTNGDMSGFSSNDNFDFTMEVLIHLTSTCFVIKDKEHLEFLFKDEEVSRRLSMTLNHFDTFIAIAGDKPKLFFEDWMKSEYKTYKSYRNDQISFKLDSAFADKLKRKPRSGKSSETPHNKMKFVSIINSKLWDDGVWQLFGYGEDHYGALIIIGFKNHEPLLEIFKEWQKEIGQQDLDDRIKITIIRGVDKNHPFRYRVHISTNLNNIKFEKDGYVTTASRFHEMTPTSPDNLTRTIKGFNKHKRFRLLPAKIIDPLKGQAEPIFETFILKQHLHVREAWEIGVNDPDQVVIRKDDNPIIPKSETNAPIIELLKKKNEA